MNTAAPAAAASSVPTGLSGALRLNDLALIHAHGEDAARFLHGQLSNDVLKVGPTQARLAALCNAQGRMLASFVIGWRPATPGSSAAADGLWLALATDLQPGILKRLRMFVLRAKVVLDDASESAAVLGLVGTAAAERLGAPGLALQPWQQIVVDGAAVVRLPDALGLPRWLWLGDAVAAESWTASLPAIQSEDWQWLDVQAGVATVCTATSAQFVPQMLNYEVVGGVDFRKGCYPGQEVVARSQYLGKLKRRAFLLTQDGGEAARPGQEIFWSEEPSQPAGMVAGAAQRGAQMALLAELKTAVVATGTLHLGQPDGPRLIVEALPYVVPAPEAASRPA